MKTERDILVIDDEAVVAQAMLKICSAEGMSVDMAKHGTAGLRMLEKCSYRLIICDIMMANVDGFQFLAEVARRNILTPVIMVTGYSTVENSVRSLSFGAIDFFPKPFTADELLSVVRRGLEYSRLQQAAAASSAAGSLVPSVYVPCPPKYYRLGYVSWAMVEHAGTVLIGVSDLFLKTIEGIRKIDLSPADEKVAQGNICAVVTSAQALTHGVMCPVSGRIVEMNAEAASNPAMVEKDPYCKGWLYRVLPSSLEYDLKHLILCNADRM